MTVDCDGCCDSASAVDTPTISENTNVVVTATCDSNARSAHTGAAAARSADTLGRLTAAAPCCRCSRRAGDFRLGLELAHAVRARLRRWDEHALLSIIDHRVGGLNACSMNVLITNLHGNDNHRFLL